MKFAAIILSFLVIAMSTITYCADDDCSVENENITINHDTPEEDDCANCCSPFLSCHTSTGFTLPLTNFELNFSIIENSAPFTTFYKETNSEFSVHIWQPPQSV